MSVDFTPSRGEYTELKPFRYWCQKVLPLVYDDSLSYYELLSKVLDSLNKAMEDVETLNDDVTALYTAYTSLQNWVTNYIETFFEGEGIENAVDDAIDRMVVSGEFGTIVNDKVAAQINAVVASQLGTVVQGQLPSVVQTQINPVVANQLPGVVNNKIGDVADAWLQAHVQSQTGTLDHTINSSGSAPLSFPLKNLIQGVKGAYSFIDKYLLADYTDTDYHNDVITFRNIFKDNFTPPEYPYGVRSKFYKKGNTLVLTSYPDENWDINAYPSVIPITRNLIPPMDDSWDASTNDAVALTVSGLSGLDKNAINKYFVNINSGDTIRVAFDLNLTYQGNFNGSLSLTGWKLIKVYVSNNAVTYQELADFNLLQWGTDAGLYKIHGECEYTFSDIDKETPGNPATIDFGLAIVTGEEIAWGHYSGNTNYMARSNTYDLTITGEVVDTEVTDLQNGLNKIATVYNNIIDDKTFINRFTAPNGQGANNDSWRQFMIPVTPGETYSFSGSRFMTCFYKNNDQIGNVVEGGFDGVTARVLTVPATATLLKISFLYENINTVAVVNSNTVITKEQTEHAFPANTFEVYSKPEIDHKLSDVPEIVYLSATTSNYRQVLESITDSSPTKRYQVWLSKGTYDIWNMFTEEEQADTNFKGLWTPPFTSLIGTQNGVVLTCDAPSARSKLATVNLDVTASISNCKVTATNCRYAIHDDWNTKKWYNDSTLPDYWSQAFYKGFVRICENVETEIVNSQVGASWGCGTVNAAVWVYKNCKIGSGGTYSYICHNDNGSLRGSNVTLENCRCGSKIRFSSLNLNFKSDCYAHLIGCSATGINLTEESASNFGAGIRWHVDGYANTFDNSDVVIGNTDSEDYSGNVDLI